MPTTKDSDKVAYCNAMEQVKRRLRLLDVVVSGGVRTGDEGADVEFACLQIRRALELVAFATLCANRERYAQVRGDFERDWSAKRILNHLRKMHSDFYPLPLSPVPEGPGRWHFDRVTDGFLTEKEFEFLYDQCSEAIHEWNPFRPGPRLVDLKRSIGEWASRIELLLKFHRVRLIDQSDLLIVCLTDPTDGRAHVLTATPQAGQPTRAQGPRG